MAVYDNEKLGGKINFDILNYWQLKLSTIHLLTTKLFIMKKQLLFNFRMVAFAAMTLLTAQSSFSQTWVGATSADFLDATNWSAAPTFTNVDVFIVNAVFAPNNNPVLNAAATCGSIATKVGSIFTTNADFTTGISTSSVEGTVNVNGGTWSSSKLYIGNASGGAGVVNVATGGVLKGTGTETGTGVWRLGSSSASGSHYLNINDGGTFILAPECGLTIGFASTRRGYLNVNIGGLAQISGGFALSTTVGNGTVNVAGGTLEYNPANLNANAGVINITAGSLKLLNAMPTINATSSFAGTYTAGLINIAGGSLVASGPLTIGSTTAGMVTVNVNGGTMNIAGALSILSTALVTIDAGSIVLDGDQTAGIATLVADARIVVSGAALAAGKTISNTYDAVSGKTTVVAAAPLGLNDAALDANAIVVYSQNQNIMIQSGNLILSDVKVYDVRGSLVASKKNIGSNETSIDLNASYQVYVVKVTTADGSVVTKKIVQ